MFHTLRTRFILSHILPTLVVLPLMGIALVYLLETQVLLNSLSTEVIGQARLVAELASKYPGVWSDPNSADSFVEYYSPVITARLMLLDPQGHLLASSAEEDHDLVGQVINLPGLAYAQQGDIDSRLDYNQRLTSNVVDVLVPVKGQDGHLLGIVRLTHKLEAVIDRFQRLRYLITAVLGGGLILGALLGWYLALDMERPLRRITEALTRLASGERLENLPEKGPDETRAIARAVNTLNYRLQLQLQARRQLLANLVHELGRPLGALQSAIQALQGGAIEHGDLRDELLEGVGAEIKILRRLLDDLSGLYDQVLGTLELDRKKVALSDWLPGALATWRQAAATKRLLWKVSIPDTLPVLEMDGERIAQALGNLLSNAIKYTPPGGTISVAAGIGQRDITNEPSRNRSQDRGKFVWIAVTDTGTGIPPEQQERIFTPFYRGQAARFPQGMGLGLTIARDLVVAHHGLLTVDSTPGEGSRFTIWLPMDSNRLPVISDQHDDD